MSPHQNFPTDSIEINPITTIFWQMLELYFQIPVTSKFVLNPPNSVVALLHPSILRHVLKNVGSKQLEELRGMCDVTTPAGSPVTDIKSLKLSLPPMQLYDSHCHALHLFRRTSSSKLSEVRTKSIAKRPSPLGFVVPYVVCNVVHPICWRDLASFLVRARELPDLFYSVGMHPTSWEGLGRGVMLKMAENPRIIAIGECGLDVHLVRSRESEEEAVVLEAQRTKLRVQLEVAAETGLPVIIHVRGHDGDPEGFSKLQATLISDLQQVLNSNHKIHVHCFSGTRSDCDFWLTKFPNCHFGFTSNLQSATLQEIVRVIEPTRILLESDAPFLTPPQVTQYAGRTPNTPHFLDYNLQFFSKAWNIPPQVMAHILNLNCARFYGLPPPLLLL